MLKRNKEEKLGEKREGLKKREHKSKTKIMKKKIIIIKKIILNSTSPFIQN